LIELGFAALSKLIVIVVVGSAAAVRQRRRRDHLQVSRTRSA